MYRVRTGDPASRVPLANENHCASIHRLFTPGSVRGACSGRGCGVAGVDPDDAGGAGRGQARRPGRRQRRRLRHLQLGSRRGRRVRRRFGGDGPRQSMSAGTRTVGVRATDLCPAAHGHRDGVPFTAASLNYPPAIAIDGATRMDGRPPRRRVLVRSWEQDGQIVKDRVRSRRRRRVRDARHSSLQPRRGRDWYSYQTVSFDTPGDRVNPRCASTDDQRRDRGGHADGALSWTRRPSASLIVAYGEDVPRGRRWPVSPPRSRRTAPRPGVKYEFDLDGDGVLRARQGPHDEASSRPRLERRDRRGHRRADHAARRGVVLEPRITTFVHPARRPVPRAGSSCGGSRPPRRSRQADLPGGQRRNPHSATSDECGVGRGRRRRLR